jgi:hypothetical protein
MRKTETGGYSRSCRENCGWRQDLCKCQRCQKLRRGIGSAIGQRGDEPARRRRDSSGSGRYAVLGRSRAGLPAKKLHRSAQYGSLSDDRSREPLTLPSPRRTGARVRGVSESYCRSLRFFPLLIRTSCRERTEIWLAIRSCLWSRALSAALLHTVQRNPRCNLTRKMPSLWHCALG